MTISRRSLFASALALLALPRKVAGEGLLAAPVHDDTDYLQSLLDRQGHLNGMEMEDRWFVVSRPLVMPEKFTAMMNMRIRDAVEMWQDWRIKTGLDA